MAAQQYTLRGNRVNAMDKSEITRYAEGFCNVFGLANQRGKKKRFDKLFEELTEYGIALDPIEDKEWAKMTYDFTVGHYDPSTFTISVPNRVYINACRGDREALFILFHELGHLVLAHKPLLHHSNKPPNEREDAEWQADTFAELVLARLGFPVHQLVLEFL